MNRIHNGLNQRNFTLLQGATIIRFNASNAFLMDTEHLVHTGK